MVDTTRKLYITTLVTSMLFDQSKVEYTVCPIHVYIIYGAYANRISHLATRRSYYMLQIAKISTYPLYMIHFIMI